MTLTLSQKLTVFPLPSYLPCVCWILLAAFDKRSDCICTCVTILTHDWSMEVGPLVQRVDALDSTRIGAFGSIEEKVVSTALAVHISISAIVTPGVGAKRHHQVTLAVQLVVSRNVLL